MTLQLPEHCWSLVVAESLLATTSAAGHFIARPGNGVDCLFIYVDVLIYIS